MNDVTKERRIEIVFYEEESYEYFVDNFEIRDGFLVLEHACIVHWINLSHVKEMIVSAVDVPARISEAGRD